MFSRKAIKNLEKMCNKKKEQTKHCDGTKSVKVMSKMKLRCMVAKEELNSAKKASQHTAFERQNLQTLSAWGDFMAKSAEDDGYDSEYGPDSNGQKHE